MNRPCRIEGADMGFCCRLWSCLRAILMTLIITSLGCGKATAPTAPVVVDSPTHNFGRRHQGEELWHTFVFTNQMDSSVEIIKAVSSCSCTVVGEDGRLPDTAIPPHGTLRIPIRLHIGSAQEVASGRIVVFYRLDTDPADLRPKRFFHLHLRADVIPDYRITPRELDFGEIDGLSTQLVTRTLCVTPDAAKNVVIKQVRSTSDFLSACVLPGSGNSGNYEIKVNLDVSGFAENRSLSGSLVISTDSKQLPEAVVGVRVKYLAPATIEPTMIVIGSDQKGEVARELCISSSQPSRIRTVSTRSDAVHVEFDGRQESREHRLRLLVAPCHQKALDSELKIELVLFPIGGNSLVRVFSIPVHRFLHVGD